MTTVAPETRSDSERMPKVGSDASDLLELFPINLRLPDVVISAGADACEKWFVDLTLANHDSPNRIELNAKGGAGTDAAHLPAF